MWRAFQVLGLVGVALMVAGCPKGSAKPKDVTLINDILRSTRP